jgi:hypothetical protein
MAQISNIKLPSGTGYGIRAGAIPFGEVDSTSTSTAFTATVPGITELVDGTTVMLRNGQVTSASGFTLNVNGLGARPVYNSLATGDDRADPPKGPTRDTTIFNVAYTMLFVYTTKLGDTGVTNCWVCYRGYDSNSNTIGYQLRTNSGNLPAIEAGARYRIWLTSLDGLHWVPINTSTSSDATTSRSLNTRVIDPFGPIVYNSTNGSVAKDARPAVTTLWQQYTLSIGYSYVKTLTAWKPVYLKCTPQSSGGVVMNDIVQALPTSADGKVYIYLGQAYSTSAMELRAEHPVYYYKDGAIRLWSNAEAATIPTSTQSATTGISIANHSSASIYGVKEDTTSVTGVQSTTTTASHVKSGGNGTAPTLGTAFSVPNVTAAGSGSFTQGEDEFTPNVPTAIDTTKFSGGSFTRGTFSGGSFTQGTDSFTTNVPTKIDTTKFSGGSYSHTGFSGGSFTRGSFSGGSLSMAIDGTDSKQLNISFTAATHGNDSFTAASYGTDSFTAAKLNTGFYTVGTAASFTQGTDSFTPASHANDSFTAAKLNTGFYTAGTAASFTQGVDSHTHTPPTLGTKFTIPNVTSAGSASNWVFEDVTVPIKNSSATTVPVRNTSATTVATSVNHTVTDNGHTHNI